MAYVLPICLRDPIFGRRLDFFTDKSTKYSPSLGDNAMNDKALLMQPGLGFCGVVRFLTILEQEHSVVLL